MSEDRLTIIGGTVVTEAGSIEKGYIQIEAGKIVSFGKWEEGVQKDGDETITLPPGCWILPGMIDVHIHGADGADTMDASEESLERIARALPREGSTAFLATTMTQAPAAIEQALQVAGAWMEAGVVSGGAECLGIHLEGPFISAKRAGAQPLEHIHPPDVELFRRWQALSGNHIRLVTLAPEEPGGMELIAHLRGTGVIASIGHSDASYVQVVEAIEAGASHITHLFNGMRGFHHRDPGVVGAAWLREELGVEIIPDGIHSSEDSLLLTYKQVGPERLVLITDAMRAKCLHDGTYDLGGQRVTVGGREARLSDGTLAGSILPMHEGALRMQRVAACSWDEIARMTALNAARELGISDRKGSIAVGKDADLAVWGANGEIVLTICRGKVAYRRPASA
ncbi:N-acetylglucosamine 6-phosphate deacetylase [Desmospora activa DSM 45169]|uniref:N-acetylglucosamine-6-phosphate deacetylase n=2 Tax=Desmospora TaxID=500614 RepID=A0A2T4ZAT4_9BACL|nr:N-acetylglucosamine-6-phosphate deacetylase [Desmospora activa]PTM59011.1 N-acetylglucosamine 6-phosphate deacetylase [Desmospora activa DSM 45169]